MSSASSEDDEGARLIHHQVHGAIDASRPILVLIHGWCCDATYWREQIDFFSGKFTVVTLDLSGHGRSSTNRAEYSMSSFAEDVRSVVLSIPSNAPVTVVGHSMGGFVAVEVAGLLRDRVRAVIGVDTFRDIGLPALSATDFEQAIAGFINDFALTTRLFVENSFFRTDSNPDLRRWIVDDMASADPEIGVAALRGINEWDGAHSLSQVDVPVVAINSDQRDTDDSRIKRFAPNFRLVTISGCGHFPMMEDPARFNAALLAELDKL